MVYLDFFRGRFMAAEEVCRSCHQKQRAVIRFGKGRHNQPFCVTCGSTSVVRKIVGRCLTEGQIRYFMEGPYE
jgi:hypothetical protein